MYISHAIVEHFRALDKVDIPLNQFSVLIGENDVGKTSFLYALDKFFANKKISDEEEFFSRITTNNINITLTFNDLPKDPRLDPFRRGDGTIMIRKVFQFGIIPDANAILYDGSEKKVNSNVLKEFFSENSFHFIPVNRNLSTQFSMNKTALFGKTLRAKMRESIQENKDKDLLPHIKSLMENSLDKPRKQLEIFLQEQMHNEEIKILFDGLTVDPTEGVTFNVKLSDEKISAIPIENRGAGTQNNIIIALFRLVANLGIGKSLIFAMEEPENSLHPKAQRQLLAVLQEISKDSQIIVTTHSPVFIDRTQFENNIILTRTPKGNTIAKTFNQNMLKELRTSLGIRASDALLKGGGNCAILVEGNTEEDGFPIFMEMSGFSDFKLGTAILNMQGSNMSKYEKSIRLLLAYDIPCVAVLDKDAQNVADDLKRCITAEKGLPNLKHVFCLKDGSIEDYYPLKIIAEVINLDLSLEGIKVSEKDFDSSKHGRERIDNILKVMYEKGLGDPGTFFKRRIGLTGTRLMEKKGLPVPDEIKKIFEKVVDIVNEE